MARAHNPKIVTDGLVLCLDAANPKSYPGSGTTWTDLSGNGNNGTLVNGVGYNSDNKGAMVFDGVDDYIDTENIQFERTDSFTLSAWVKSTTAVNIQIINNEASNYRGYMLTISTDSTVLFGLRHTTTNRIQTRTNELTSPNRWYHLSATYSGNSDASGVKLYINSENQQTTAVANNLSSTTISDQTTWIGRRRPASQGPFNGSISQVSIHNRALTPQEIQQNFQALRGRYGI